MNECNKLNGEKVYEKKNKKTEEKHATVHGMNIVLFEVESFFLPAPGSTFHFQLPIILTEIKCECAEWLLKRVDFII